MLPEVKLEVEDKESEAEAGAVKAIRPGPKLLIYKLLSAPQVHREPDGLLTRVNLLNKSEWSISGSSFTLNTQHFVLPSSSCLSKVSLQLSRRTMKRKFKVSVRLPMFYDILDTVRKCHIHPYFKLNVLLLYVLYCSADLMSWPTCQRDRITLFFIISCEGLMLFFTLLGRQVWIFIHLSHLESRETVCFYPVSTVPTSTADMRAQSVFCVC